MNKGMMLIALALGAGTLASTAAATTTPPKPRHPLPPALAEFDINKDGVLSATEREALKKAMEDRHKAFIAKYDKNGDGVLDATERAAARADLEAAEKAERTKLFAGIDTNGNGSLSLDEFKAAHKDQNTPRVEAAFKHLDANSDSAISLDEFLAKPAPRPPHHP